MMNDHGKFPLSHKILFAGIFFFAKAIFVVVCVIPLKLIAIAMDVNCCYMEDSVLCFSYFVVLMSP